MRFHSLRAFLCAAILLLTVQGIHSQALPSYCEPDADYPGLTPHQKAGCFTLFTTKINTMLDEADSAKKRWTRTENPSQLTILEDVVAELSPLFERVRPFADPTTKRVLSKDKIRLYEKSLSRVATLRKFIATQQSAAPPPSPKRSSKQAIVESPPEGNRQVPRDERQMVPLLSNDASCDDLERISDKLPPGEEKSRTILRTMTCFNGLRQYESTVNLYGTYRYQLRFYFTTEIENAYTKAFTEQQREQAARLASPSTASLQGMGPAHQSEQGIRASTSSAKSLFGNMPSRDKVLVSIILIVLGLFILVLVKVLAPTSWIFGRDAQHSSLPAEQSMDNISDSAAPPPASHGHSPSHPPACEGWAAMWLLPCHPNIAASRPTHSRTLREAMDNQLSFSLDEAKQLLLPACKALQFAHNRKIAHTNLAPETILVTRNGVVKVFGFTVIDGIPQTAEDIKALGVCLYELMSGERPVPGSGYKPLIASQPGTVSELDALILTAIAEDPSKRPQSPREFAHRLDSIKT